MFFGIFLKLYTTYKVYSRHLKQTLYMTIFRWLMSYCLSGNSAKHDPDSIGHHSPMDLQDREGDHLHHVVCCRLPSGQRPRHFGPSTQSDRFLPDKQNRNRLRNCMPAEPDGFWKDQSDRYSRLYPEHISVPGCHRK